MNIDVGLVTEVDSSLGVARSKLIDIGIATEVDTAKAIGINPVPEVQGKVKVSRVVVSLVVCEDKDTTVLK